MPLRDSAAPTVLTIPNDSAPCTLRCSSIRIPVRAYAVTPISSNHTNASKTSPASTNPEQAPRNTSTSATYDAPASARKCHDQVSAATVSNPTRHTRSSAARSTTSATPTGWPCTGSQPPCQMTRVVSPMSTADQTAAAVTPIATARPNGSATRWPNAVTDSPATTAPARRGATTSITTRVFIAASLLELLLERADPVRVDAPLPLGELDRQGQQQRGHRTTDDDVGEGQCLHHGIDHGHAGVDVREHRRGRVAGPADHQQQQVRRRLHQRQADDDMDEAAAGRDPVATHQQDPGGHRVRQDPERITHDDSSPSRRTTSAWSRNLASSSTRAEATSIPTATLNSSTVPPDARSPRVPVGSQLARNGSPTNSAESPSSTKPAAPIASATSKTASGRTRRRMR